MLFMALLAVVCAGAPWLSIFYLFPIMLYGIAHNGLRFSMFWVFLGLVFAQGRYGAGSGTRAVRPSAVAQRRPGRVSLLGSGGSGQPPP
jgi:hypothetical protein